MTPMNDLSDSSNLSNTPTILFAGGGTGGHIFPNLAIWERLTATTVAPTTPPSPASTSTLAPPPPPPPLRAHFLLSNRALDRDILTKTNIPFTQLDVKPWSSKPWHWPAFLAALFKAKKEVEAIIDRENVKAIVITGGFVSGPAAMAAKSKRIPLALVNLDAVPGKANRQMAAKARALGAVFSAYDSPALPGATRIGLPLRLSALSPATATATATAPAPAPAPALSPSRYTLMITGGSQGASSVNLAVLELLRHREVQAALKHWQILHITGPTKDEEIAKAYADMELPAVVMPFCDTMGQAWGAATIAISRSGAGSVAEAWANGVPTIFLPYPFHKDDHQRLNAGPIVEAGGAILLKDLIDAKLNASQLASPFLELVCDEKKREQMKQSLGKTKPIDGAEAVARWVMEVAFLP